MKVGRKSRRAHRSLQKFSLNAPDLSRDPRVPTAERIRRTQDLVARFPGSTPIVSELATSADRPDI